MMRKYLLIAVLFIFFIVLTEQRGRMKAPNFMRRTTRPNPEYFSSFMKEQANQRQQMISKNQRSKSKETLNINPNSGTNSSSIRIYIFIFFAVAAIGYYIYKKSQTENFDTLKSSIHKDDRQRKAELQKAQFFLEHGVHPDRATRRYYKRKFT